MTRLLLTTAAAISIVCCDGTRGADDVAQAPPTASAQQQADRLQGKAIYQRQCASCHGKQGQGVPDAHPDPLVGDASVAKLTTVIAKTMPEGKPQACAGQDAAAVAAYIYDAFYSEAAQLRNRPPRQRLARLTAGQLRQSLADLYAHFDGNMWPGAEHGVRGVYFDGARYRNDRKKIERIDPVLNFDFQDKGPGGGIDPKDFYINWRGAVQVDVTGRYEIVIRCSCAFLSFFGSYDQEFINNRIQSGDKTEFRRSVFLTAGRVYPLQIEMFQRKRKTKQPPARISLRWNPPSGPEQIIPRRNLLAAAAPPAFALQAKLPPDDRSYGYDRGIAVDRQWDESVTVAAVEFAEAAARELWPRYRRKHDPNRGNRRRRNNRDKNKKNSPTDNKKADKKNANKNADKNADKNDAQKSPQRELLHSFLTEIVETAFRGPLDDATRTLYVDKPLRENADDGQAIRRCLLISLKSPRFLYPLLDAHRSPSRRVANRLALTMFDSLPADQWLLKLVEDNKLTDTRQIRQAASQMVSDPRMRGKTREMLYEWANLRHRDEIVKDGARFPKFDATLIGDLRHSFDATLDQIVWSESSDYRQLFQADWCYTSPRLNDFYGPTWRPAGPGQGATTSGQKPGKSKPGPDTDADNSKPGQPGPTESDQADSWTKSVGDPGRRFGILTHPYLMSSLAYRDSTSPIHRGVFLIRHVLGRTLRPPNEAFTPLSPVLHPDLTTRQRVALQTSPQNCQVCHAKINALGFTLENFDAVGRYRLQDKKRPLDASGSYTTRSGLNVEFGGPADLARFLAENEDAQRAFVHRAFRHFVKQPIAAYNPNQLDTLTQTFKQKNFSIRELLVEIAVIASSPNQDTHTPKTGARN